MAARKFFRIKGCSHNPDCIMHTVKGCQANLHWIGDYDAWKYFNKNDDQCQFAEQMRLYRMDQLLQGGKK